MTGTLKQATAQASSSGLLYTGDWIALVGVGIAIIALLWQMRSLRKQLMLQTFSDYTKRYQEIILHFPEEINQTDFDLSSRDDKSSVMRYMRVYYDLCFEEYYLSKRKLIDERTWNDWREGMEFAFSKSAFQQAWQLIKKDTQYKQDFCALVEKAQSSNI